MIVDIPLGASLLLGACLIWLSIEDIRHLSFSVVALAIYGIISLWVGWALHGLAWPYLATGAALCLGFLVADYGFRRLKGHAALGSGDAILVAGSGVILGPLAAPQLVFISSLGGLAVMGLMRMKQQTASKLLPFGPFLALATWLLFLEGPLLL